MTGLVLIGGGGHCKAAIDVIEAAGLREMVERLVFGEVGRHCADTKRDPKWISRRQRKWKTFY